MADQAREEVARARTAEVKRLAERYVGQGLAADDARKLAESMVAERDVIELEAAPVQ